MTTDGEVAFDQLISRF